MKKWLKIFVALAVLVGVVAVGVMLTPSDEANEQEETGCYHDELNPSIVDDDYHNYHCTVCGNSYKEKHDFTYNIVEDEYGIHKFCKCGLEQAETEE